MPPKKFTSKRKKHTVFVPWPYFLYTIPYGIYYITGAIVGYARTKNLICLFVSGIAGILILLLGIGHFIEYRRGIEIENKSTVDFSLP